MPGQIQDIPHVNGWVDVHCHFWPPRTEEQLRTQQDALRNDCGWCMPEPFRYTVEHQLDYMNSRGIAMQMLSQVPQNLDALKDSNDYGASLVRKHPSRFGLLAALPTNDADACLAEIKRGADELNADGYAVLTNYHDVYLGDPLLEPVMKELNERKAVVFSHPNAYAPANLGRPSPVIEVAFDTARTVTNMLYNGVFRRYPDIRWIFSHCGGAFPALVGRLGLLGTEEWVPNPQEITKEEIERQTRALYVDTAATATEHLLNPAISVVGKEHICYGSDSGVPCSTDQTIDQNLRNLLSFKSMTDDEKDAVGKRAFELFPEAAKRANKGQSNGHA